MSDDLSPQDAAAALAIDEMAWRRAAARLHAVSGLTASLTLETPDQRTGCIHWIDLHPGQPASAHERLAYDLFNADIRDVVPRLVDNFTALREAANVTVVIAIENTSVYWEVNNAPRGGPGLRGGDGAIGPDMLAFSTVLEALRDLRTDRGRGRRYEITLVDHDRAQRPMQLITRAPDEASAMQQFEVFIDAVSAFCGHPWNVARTLILCPQRAMP
jgi:hypothetical protein